MFPVCAQKDAMSLTDPGSLAMTSSTSPLASWSRALRVLSMGSGQFRPRASSFRAATVMVISCNQFVTNGTNIYMR